ncbi:hypothetical protein JXO59_04100, partial [candidate division KSB1 bacterium]|nr:hypothetical protein [candidate division KSB1 bacterium]
AETHRFASDLQFEFFWNGTIDQAAYLSVAEAIRFMGSLLTGGWPELMASNRGLALEARDTLCAALDIAKPCPDEMVGTMAAVPIPDAADYPQPVPAYYLEPLQERLFREYRIDLLVYFWPQPPGRILRVSAQLYNALSQYQRLARTLKSIFAADGSINGARHTRSYL